MDKKAKAKSLAKRIAFSSIGIILISLGTTICRVGGVGVDPFTAMNIGVSSMLGLSLGVYQLGVNLAILVLIFIFGRSQIGIGTVLNMVFVGFLIDFFTWLLTAVIPVGTGLVVSAVALVVGVALFTFGVSMYMNTDTGVAPYDAIALVITARTNAPYTPVRMGQDILVAAIAFLVAGPIGVFTVIAAFFTGPLITFWNDHVTVKALKLVGAYREPKKRTAHAAS